MHRADRMLFPSLRFVRASRTAAVRLRPPSEWWLLIVRTAAVALAVCAVARPILQTKGRVTAWNARTARAVVVDTSDSMRTRNGRQPAEQTARESATAEASAASY